ncbi:hypothetical protein N7492_006983 [Penicillium capsulatum]|uniref:Xylose isomerase-like TIM barrel domain-containing protein n=1 Tax=Penicillium capsulatum TaxID=69766 RepID=A0A9W9I149_9EURO|nr:hypothetical protein N7492_006983 [Penicillium capsulatum]KAJ6116816.1 hypothetical protein N7512_006541 [Penicillium capsulatum]
MPSVSRFRSIWGIPTGDNYENWAKWFPTLKAQGYVGVEIDFAPLTSLPTIRQIADSAGLEISVLVHSKWPQYVGPKPLGLTPKVHLDGYRTQLEIAKALKPVLVNAHSGDDAWTVDEAVEFFEGTLAIDAELGFAGKVHHETHRNRAFYSPYLTAQVLGRVPKLRVTADISHFVVVSERLLDEGPGDRELLNAIIPHVGHIHARIGTTQSSQCPDPTHEVFTAEREFFERVWKQIIEVTAKSEPITFVPEYGPFPYHPFGSATSFSDVADSEGSRLQVLFEKWANSA